MSLSEQFQNSDSFICIKGMYFFQQLLRWKMKNDNSDAKPIQKLIGSRASGSLFTNFSCILPSRVGYYAGKPIESTV